MAKAQKPITKSDSPPADDWEEIDNLEIDGWWKPTEGQSVQGIISHSFEIDNEDGTTRKVLVARLTAPVDAEIEGDLVQLKPGQVVGIGYRYNLRALFDYEKGTEFLAIAHGQAKLKGNRTMWTFKVRVKRGSLKTEPNQRLERHTPSANRARARGRQLDLSDDDLPF